ncbi:Crp/Fnr family transcriptional regulator [Sphingomonas montanisoli]|nr:Crp/Fnr family transcriptional regulator [Sphingomonas montanisoli]
MMTGPLHRFAQRLRLRVPLGDDDISAMGVLPFASLVAGQGTTIYDPNSNADSYQIVAQGLAANFRQGRSGQRQLTALRIVGDTAEPAATALGWNPTGLVALSDVTILQVPLEAVRTLSRQRPHIAQALYYDCAFDAASLARLLGNSRRIPAIARVAHLLCELAVRYRVAGQASENQFGLLMTQSDIGDATGSTSVHVNRVMQALRMNGLIDTTGRSVRILNWTGLSHLAEFDPTPFGVSDELGAAEGLERLHGASAE